jgi:tight adherence protein B
MQQLIVPILIALAAALFVWGVAVAFLQVFAGEKRKLQQRLAAESRLKGGSAGEVSVRLLEADALGGLLGRIEFARKLQRSLTQAWPDMTPKRFLTITAVSCLGSAALVTVLTASFVVGLIAGTLGLLAPFMVLTNKRNRRQKMLMLQLPDALDFLSRALRAGHSFSGGLQMMGEELPQPLGGEFGRAYDQHSVGVSIEAALRDMVERIDSTDFAFFVTATLIQRQTGGDLSEVLNNISGMIRQRIRLQQHVKAKTAEGRFTGYILSAFPALMYVISYVLNPEYAGKLLQDSTGIGMLIAAGVMALMGLFFIKKLTTVKV